MDLLVADWMPLLYGFNPARDGNLAKDLTAYAWNGVEAFLNTGGKVCVFCFDRTQHVPAAKSDEQIARRKTQQLAPLIGQQTTPLTDECVLQEPWFAALQVGGIRTALIEYLTQALHRHFLTRLGEMQVHLRASARFEFITHWGLVQRSVFTVGQQPRVTQSSIPSYVAIGEADVGVIYWLKHFENLSAVLRVQDTDELLLAVLNHPKLKSGVARHLWLMARTGEHTLPPGVTTTPPIMGTDRDAQRCIAAIPLSIFTVGLERKDIISFDALYGCIEEKFGSVDIFSILVILQSSDFVKKIVRNVGVEPFMEEAQKLIWKYLEPQIIKDCEFDLQGLKALLKEIVAALILKGKKRAQLVDNYERECLRAWWNFVYWRTAHEGPLDPLFYPGRTDEEGRSVYGWNAEGGPPKKMRI